jgi:hypothetical protein
MMTLPMITAIDPARSSAKATVWARRQRFGRKARASLLGALLGCVALQLGLTLTLEPWFPQFRDPFYYQKAHRLLARIDTSEERPITVVMLGSSRTAFGLRGLQIEQPLGERLGRRVVVFNGGVFGSGPITELLYLKRMFQEGLRPDLLLIEVMPTCLVECDRGPAEASWLDPSRLNRHELLFLERYGISTGKMRRERTLGKVLPWYYHRFAIMSCLVPKYLPMKDRMDFSGGTDAAGFAPCLLEPRSPEERQQYLERMRVQFGCCFVNFHFSAAACRALDDALVVCRQRDIPAILVLMPEGNEYQKLYEGATRAQIDRFLQALCQAHGVPLLDARSWVEDDDFSDGHHLLPRGALVFTERLGRSLPGLLQEKRLAVRGRAGEGHQ